MVGRVDDGVHAAIQDADCCHVESDLATGWHGKRDEVRREQEEEDVQGGEGKVRAGVEED